MCRTTAKFWKNCHLLICCDPSASLLACIPGVSFAGGAHAAFACIPSVSFAGGRSRRPPAPPRRPFCFALWAISRLACVARSVTYIVCSLPGALQNVTLPHTAAQKLHASQGGICSGGQRVSRRGWLTAQSCVHNQTRCRFLYRQSGSWIVNAVAAPGGKFPRTPLWRDKSSPPLICPATVCLHTV